MATPYFSSFVRVFNRGRNFSNTHASILEAMTTGCMFGSGISMPMLLSVGMRGVEKCALGIYAVSAVTFSSIYRSKIAEYGRYTLAFVVTISIFAIASSNISLDHITPYLPLFVALGLSITVHVAPSVVEQFQRGQDDLLQEQMPTVGHHRQATSSIAVSLGDLSRRSVASLYPLNMMQWMSFPHDLSNMDRETQGSTNQSRSVGNESDIDLEMGSEIGSAFSAEETNPMLVD